MRIPFFSRKYIGWLAMLAAACISSAASTGQEKDMRPVVEIDAANFVNKTDNPRANFRAFSDRIAHEFVQTGVYRVMNFKDVEETLKKNEVYSTISDEEGQKIAIPVPTFSVRMTVVRYGISRTGSTSALTGTLRAQNLATVEVILSVVDRSTGVTVVSKNLPPMSAAVQAVVGANGRVSGNYQEQALQEACRQVAQATVREVVLCTPFSVIDTEGGEIETDIPRSVAKPGYVFTVYRLGKVRLIRRTGKREAKKIPIGKVVLTSCDEDTSKARPLGTFSEPATTNCILMMTRPEELPPAPPPPPPGTGARPF